MPKCRKCGEKFKNWVLIEGKERNLCKRKYCLLCSPWNKHNTKKIETVKNKEKCNCNICKKDFFYERKKGGTKNICGACSQKKSRYNKRVKLIEHLGGKCKKCGYSRCIKALDFHHIESNEKELELNIRNFHLKWDVLVKEAEKCVLLCSICHKELHAGCWVYSQVG